jgi:hypothetical protein
MILRNMNSGSSIFSLREIPLDTSLTQTCTAKRSLCPLPSLLDSQFDIRVVIQDLFPFSNSLSCHDILRHFLLLQHSSLSSRPSNKYDPPPYSHRTFGSHEWLGKHVYGSQLSVRPPFWGNGCSVAEQYHYYRRYELVTAAYNDLHLSSLAERHC